MFDPIAPQNIDQLKISYVKLFKEEPLVSFCVNRFLRIIEDEWDSGQMPEEWHDKLLPLVEIAKTALTQHPQERHETVVKMLHEAHKIMPNLV